MRTEVFWVTECPIGRLGLLARPRGGDWLKDEIEEWTKAGINRVVSLLEESEIIDLALEQEGELCQSLGLDFDRLPIPDRGTAIDRSKFSELVESVVRSIRGGEGVGIHCRMGIGRTSLVAVAALVGIGLHLNTAWSAVERTQG